MIRSAFAEFRTLGLLALPIILTQLSQVSMGVADAIMAGRVGATDLAGVTLGGNLYFPLMLFMSGTIMAVTPSVSQLHGAGRLGEAGAVVRQALWIAVCGGGLLVAVLHNIGPLYRLAGVDERAIPVAVAYLKAASLGLVPVLAYVALRCLCEGMAWTWAAMLIGLSALPLKVLLNWLFIYGSPTLGVPALGGAGCGWATAIAMLYSLLVMIVVVCFSRARASNVLAAFSLPRIGEIWRLLRLGLPIGVTLFVELAFFSVATILIGRLGVETVAAHQVAFSIIAVAFMVPLALGMAATIRVGFNVGAENRAAAQISAGVAVAATLVWSVVVAAALMLFRHDLVRLYSSEHEVVQMAAGLLTIGAAFQIFDASQATMMGALRGYKDTGAPMVIALIGYWALGLPFGYAACFGADFLNVTAIGVEGLWWGLVVGLAAVSMALFVRLRMVSRPG